MVPFWSNEPGSIFSVSSEFRLYWAVTLPLTALVMVIWQTWLWLYRRPRTRKLKEPEDGAEKKKLWAHEQVAVNSVRGIGFSDHQTFEVR